MCNVIGMVMDISKFPYTTNTIYDCTISVRKDCIMETIMIIIVLNTFNTIFITQYYSTVYNYAYSQEVTDVRVKHI